MSKKIALLHRYPFSYIKETNAAFPYLQAKGMDVLTFKTFDRLSSHKKFWKSIGWIFYAPFLVVGKGYDVIYCDDSYPFYPAFVKLVSPKSKVIIRIGDLHLLYYYSGWFYKFLHLFEKIGWLMSDKIVVISEAMADYVRSEIRDSRPIVTVLDPVDPKDFPINKSYNEGSVMFHGTLTKNKNVDIFLDAANLLPNIEFVVIGDGPDFKRLKRIAPPNVFFIGWVSFREVHNYINSCAIGVALRSDNPGNNYVVTSPFIQYGIMGKPCLVTRRAVFGEYPWQFSTAHEMAEKIEVLLKLPKEGERLRNFVLENHSAEKIAEEIWLLLQ